MNVTSCNLVKSKKIIQKMFFGDEPLPPDTIAGTKREKTRKKKKAFLHSLCKKEGHQKPHFAEVPNLVTCPSLGKTK